jgi:hypothetical protein
MPCTAIREKATSKDDSRNHLTPGRFVNSLIRRSLCEGDMDRQTTPAQLFGSSKIQRQFYHDYHDNIPGSDSACHDILIRQHLLLDENSIITTAIKKAFCHFRDHKSQTRMHSWKLTAISPWKITAISDELYGEIIHQRPA